MNEIIIEDETEYLWDNRPVCWACGWPMEWSGEMNEIDLDGGELIFEEPVYRCVNPECDDEATR